MKNKMLRLMARKIAIESRGKYKDSPGVLRKVTRQIKNIEKDLI